MHFFALAKTYNSYGSHSTISLVPIFLMRGAADFGPAISQLILTFHFPHSGPPRETLEGLFDQYAESLRKLPTVTFRRQRGHADIRIASTLMDGADWDRMRKPSVSLFRGAAVETVGALTLLRKRIKPSDQFDLGAFLAHCELAQARLPATDAELDDLVAYDAQQRELRKASMSPWEILDIDWSAWHPDARSILDDPFYWDVADDFAPHGNDTGSDLLADYWRWLRKNPQGDALDFLARLLDNWGMTDDSSEVARTVIDDASVALAFAELKMKAGCAPGVAERARFALRRQRQEALEAVDWAHREQRLKRLDMLEGKLHQ
jgi:uncharacterized protein YfeS